MNARFLNGGCVGCGTSVDDLSPDDWDRTLIFRPTLVVALAGGVKVVGQPLAQICPQCQSFEERLTYEREGDE